MCAMKKEQVNRNERQEQIRGDDLQALFDALKFYADEDTHRVFIDGSGYITTRAIKDGGKRAREALDILK